MSYQARRHPRHAALTGRFRVSVAAGRPGAGRRLAAGRLLGRFRGRNRCRHRRRDQFRQRPAAASTASAQPTASSAAGPGQLRKILVIMEENHSIQQIFPGGMPYLWTLAQRYAYATDWSDVAHPSLPNYLAIFGGSDFNRPQDCLPASRLYVFGTVSLRAGPVPGRNGQGLRGVHAAAM